MDRKIFRIRPSQDGTRGGRRSPAGGSASLLFLSGDQVGDGRHDHRHDHPDTDDQKDVVQVALTLESEEVGPAAAAPPDSMPTTIEKIASPFGATPYVHPVFAR